MRTNNKGFTLVEVVCSVALLAIIVVASSTFIRSTVASQKQSKQMLYANNIAQDIMEKAVHTGNYMNQTVTKDGYRYYVEVSATANPSVVSAGYGGSEGGSSSTSIPLKFNPGTLPPKRTEAPSTTEKPGSTEKPGIPTGEPVEYNFQINLFDFIDEDSDMLSSAGHQLYMYMLKTSRTEAFTTDDDLAKALTSDKVLSGGEFADNPYSLEPFTKYVGGGVTAGGEATNLMKAVTCYKYLNRDQIKDLYQNKFVPRAATLKSKFDDRIGISKKDTNGGDTFHKRIHNQSSLSYHGHAADCPFYEKSYKMYEYLTDGTRGNIPHMVTDYVERYNKHVQPLIDSGKWNEKISGLTGLDDVYFNGLTVSEIERYSLGIRQYYEYDIDTARFSSATRGPQLLAKLVTKQSEDANKPYDPDAAPRCISWAIKNTTELVDEKSSVRFQLYPRYFNPYTFERYKNYNWNSDPSMLRGPFGVQLIDLPAGISYRKWDTNEPVFWYQKNILNIMTFYVTGGLSYREMYLTADFYGSGEGAWYYDTETEEKLPYHPAVYYFDGVSYGRDHYHFQTVDPSGWANLNSPPSIIPDGGSLPEGKNEEGEEGKEGSEYTIDYNIREGDTVTNVNFEVTGMECYSIIVHENDRNGKVLATLQSYGVPSKKSPSPTPGV